MSKEDLIPIRTEREAKEKGRNGGLASGRARREKKLLSQLYASFLAKKHSIRKDGKVVDVDSDIMIDEVIKAILAKRDSATVSLLKEMREATEGSKVRAEIESYKLTKEERQARIAELEAKRNADRE